jgi:hypothetical protein
LSWRGRTKPTFQMVSDWLFYKAILLMTADRS